jgi:hypothetical protein
MDHRGSVTLTALGGESQAQATQRYHHQVLTADATGNIDVDTTAEIAHLATSNGGISISAKQTLLR